MPADTKEILKHTVRFSPGEIIFKEGDIADCFYYIKTGKVIIFKKNDKNEEVLLNELKEGEVFGELGLIDEKENYRTATAKSVMHTTLILATKSNLFELLKHNPGFAVKIVTILVSRFAASEKKLFKIINQKNIESEFYWYLVNILILFLTNSMDKLLTEIKVEIPIDKLSNFINDNPQTIDYLLEVLEDYLCGKPKEIDIDSLKALIKKFNQEKFNNKFRIRHK